jgi:hypothetical protein
MQSGRFTTEAMPVFRHKNGFPVTVNSLGIELALLGAVQKENAATISWKVTARPGEYVIIPRVRNISYSF